VRALFLNQFYAPDIAATAQVLSALCEDLAARGHDVAVLCSSARYRTPHHGFVQSADEAAVSQAKGGQDRDAVTEQRAGVQVHRITLPSPPAATARWASSSTGKLALRLLQEARFSVGAYRQLRHLVAAQPPDVLVAMSTPPTLLLLALSIGRGSRLPVVYWVQDVYPDLLWASGLLQQKKPLHRLICAALAWGARVLYQRPDAAIALDEAMRDRLLAAGFLAERLHVIDHAASSASLRPVPVAENRVRRLLSLTPADFVVCYAGNLGRGHDFATVAAALPLLADEPALARVHLVFIGEGEGRGALLQAVPASLRSRVHALPPQEAALHRDVLSVGDIALVTLGAGFAGLMTPSKIYPLMAAARPILYVGPATGRLADLCAGWPHGQAVGERVENGDARGFVAALRRLYDDSQRREAMATQARRLAEERFDQHLATSRHEALLQRVIAEHRATVAASASSPTLWPRRT